MERRLILVRHAKSSWKDGALADHDRPLTNRGERDADRLGRELHALGWHPELVACSTAARTRATWALMEPHLGPGPVLVVAPELYHGGLTELRALALSWQPEVQCAVVIGHNPGCEDALYALSQRDAQMTTANAALLRGRGASWSTALDGRWTLEALIQPKHLDADP